MRLSDFIAGNSLEIRSTCATKHAPFPTPKASLVRNILLEEDCSFDEYKNQEFNSVFAPFTINYLRMEQLYMFMHETARIVKPDGFFCILSYVPHSGFLKNLRAKWLAKNGKYSLMPVWHYTSPENWEPIHGELLENKGAPIELWVAKRKSIKST